MRRWGLAVDRADFSFPTRFRYKVALDEVFVKSNAKARAIRYFNPTIDCLHTLVSELVSQGRLVDRVFEKERVAACAKPV